MKNSQLISFHHKYESIRHEDGTALRVAVDRGRISHRSRGDSVLYGEQVPGTLAHLIVLNWDDSAYVEALRSQQTIILSSNADAVL